MRFKARLHCILHKKINTDEYELKETTESNVVNGDLDRFGSVAVVRIRFSDELKITGINFIAHLSSLPLARFFPVILWITFEYFLKKVPIYSAIK
ncbi:hypothetical protein ACJX0J_022018, partial [Zea mays]